MEPKYKGLKPWMVMMERAQTVIPGYGRNVDNEEIHMTYEEQLKARAIDRQHDRRVEAITGITREIQQEIANDKVDPEQERYERSVNGGLSHREYQELLDQEMGLEPEHENEGHFTMSPNSDTPVWHSSAAFDRLQEALTKEKTQQTKGETMQTLDNTVQKAALSAKDLRMQQMESWIIEAISKPAMPRELRMEGLDLVQDISPTARQSVERICPSLSRSQGRELEIER